jgi:DNA-binding NarL/FixJ family response regulator
MKMRSLDIVEQLPIDFFYTKEVLYLPYVFDYRVLQNMRKLVAEKVLTNREGEVLSLRSFGLEDPEIASFLYISKGTVNITNRNAIKKLRAHFGFEYNEAEHALIKVSYGWAFKDVNS